LRHLEELRGAAGFSAPAASASTAAPSRTFFRIRNEAIKSLCSAVRRFRDSTIEDVKATISTLFKTSWKALAWADDLIQN
jgi:hypothetical protein